MRDARVWIHGALTYVMVGVASVLTARPMLFADSKLWKGMSDLLPQPSWAAFCWLSGCVGLVGLTTENKHMKIFSAAVLATAHGVLAVLITKGAGFVTGSIAYSGWAALGYYLLWRRAIER